MIATKFNFFKKNNKFLKENKRQTVIYIIRRTNIFKFIV